MLDFVDSFSPNLFLLLYLGIMLLGYIIVLFLIVKDYYKN